MVSIKCNTCESSEINIENKFYYLYCSNDLHVLYKNNGSAYLAIIKILIEEINKKI